MSDAFIPPSGSFPSLALLRPLPVMTCHDVIVTPTDRGELVGRKIREGAREQGEKERGKEGKKERRKEGKKERGKRKSEGKREK